MAIQLVVVVRTSRKRAVVDKEVVAMVRMVDERVGGRYRTFEL